MSYIFSRALVEACSPGSCSGTDASAPLSVMPTAHPFWRRDKMMESSLLSLSGQMCEVLTADRGEELLRSFLAGFPAPTSQPREKAKESKEANPGLWKEMARIVGDIRPIHVRVENSPMLTSRGLGVVLGDLAAMGFDARWGVLGAASFGFAHLRERIWVLATHPERCEWRPEQHDGPDRRMGRQQQPFAWDRNWLDVFARVRGNGDGMADRLDRTDAIRNGQVPRVAAAAWRMLADAPPLLQMKETP